MTLPVPNWLNQLSVNRVDDVRLRNRYLVRSSALFHSSSGQLEPLASDLGIAYSTLAGLYGTNSGVITPGMAIRLETLLGRNFITREMIRPDIFKI